VEELPGRASSGRASVLATWRAGGRGGPRSSRRSVAMQCRTRHWGRVFSPWPARAAVGKRGTGCAPGLPRPGRPGSTAFVSRVGNRSKRWQRGSSHLGAGESGGQVGVGEQAYLAYLVAYLAYLAYLARNHLAWATGRVGRGRPWRSCLVLRTYSWRRSPLGSSRCTSLALS
jgi:hypothetical protein